VREAIQQFGLDDQGIGEAALGDDVLGYLEISHRARAGAGKVGARLEWSKQLLDKRGWLCVFGKGESFGHDPDGRAPGCACCRWPNGWCRRVRTRSRFPIGRDCRLDLSKTGRDECDPGEVRLSLDVRHRSDETRSGAIRELMGLGGNDREKARALFRSGIRMLEQDAVCLMVFLPTKLNSRFEVRDAGRTAWQAAQGTTP